jgi:hypothetical protein
MFAQSQVVELMSDLELSVTKFMDIKEEETHADLLSLRDHFIEIYQRIGVGLLKRH